MLGGVYNLIKPPPANREFLANNENMDSIFNDIFGNSVTVCHLMRRRLPQKLVEKYISNSIKSSQIVQSNRKPDQ